MLEREVEVLRDLKAVLHAIRDADFYERQPRSTGQERIDSRNKRIELIDALHKRIQARLLLLEQPLSQVSKIGVYVPREPEAVPEIVSVKMPRWWPRPPKRKIIWEKK